MMCLATSTYASTAPLELTTPQTDKYQSPVDAAEEPQSPQTTPAAPDTTTTPNMPNQNCNPTDNTINTSEPPADVPSDGGSPPSQSM